METTLKIGLDFLPYVWQLVLGFAAGCWFYRYLLKNNPKRLQQLVDVVNSSGSLVSKVEKAAGNALDSASVLTKGK